jgi:Lrp/AsnC family transcriptional regulator, regulator for asnA, asnC and gidA
MVDINPIDKAIIDLLQEDGRMECTEIARRIGNVSARSVRYRINRLITDGVIKIGAIIEPKAVGFPVRADVWVAVELGQAMEVARRIAAFEQVSYTACSTGDVDVSLQVTARDNVELYHFVSDVISQVPGVKKTTIQLLPIILKDIYQWKLPASSLE